MRILAPVCLLVSLGLGPWSARAGSGDWRGLFEAPSVEGRGSVGVTAPLAVSLPEWSRRNAADLGFLSGNPAFLALVPAERGRIVPVSLNAAAGGPVWTYGQATSAAPSTPEDLLAEMGGASVRAGQVERARLEVNAYGIADGFGLAAGYLRSRDALLRESGTLVYNGFQEGRAMIGAASELFNTPRAGSFSYGIALKGVVRRGDEVEIAEASTQLEELLSSGEKSAGAVGMDIGLHYRMPATWTGRWSGEAGFVWRDMGETAFVFGPKTSRGQRFSAYPNNIMFGLGAAAPSFWRGTRMAVRAEFSEWGRPISWFERTGLSAELRFPALVSVQAGLRGLRPSTGAVLRFSGVEVEIAVRNQPWAGATRSSWLYLSEIRGVY